MQDLLGPLGSLADGVVLLALATTRIAAAFALLPLFSPQVIPALVRNAVFLALALLSLAMQPSLPMSDLSSMQWIALFAKEATVGIVLGFGLAAFLWAFDAAGSIVDTKIAVANGQIFDPLADTQASPTAVLLSRVATFVFIASGGFMLFVGVLLESYRLFPVTQLGLNMRWAAVEVFEQHFSDLMAMAVIIAAPALVVMFVIDLALGLVNRYAPQLNLVSVSMSLKSLVGIGVWIAVLAYLLQAFSDELARRIARILPEAARMIGAS
jgi:type III secretion protein T